MTTARATATADPRVWVELAEPETLAVVAACKAAAVRLGGWSPGLAKGVRSVLSGGTADPRAVHAALAHAALPAWLEADRRVLLQALTAVALTSPAQPVDSRHTCRHCGAAVVWRDEQGGGWRDRDGSLWCDPSRRCWHDIDRDTTSRAGGEAR